MPSSTISVRPSAPPRCPCASAACPAGADGQPVLLVGPQPGARPGCGGGAAYARGGTARPSSAGRRLPRDACDRINPYGGGPTARWGESVLDAASAWARANGHSPEPERAEFTPSLTRLSYGPLDDPGAVTLWVCDGAGHTWPGTRLTLGLRLFLGKVSAST